MSAGGLPPRSGISQLQLFFSSFGKWQNWESWWPDFQNISQIDSKIFANIWERLSAKHCNTIVGAESAKSQINPDHDCTVCVSQIWTFFAQTSQFLYTHDVPIFLHFLCKNIIKRIFAFIFPIFFYFLCKNISKRKLAFLALFLGGGGGGGLPIEYITLFKLHQFLLLINSDDDHNVNEVDDDDDNDDDDDDDCADEQLPAADAGVHPPRWVQTLLPL